VSEDHQIEPSRASELIESGAVVVDVRTTEEYEAGHIPGARHVPLEDLGDDTAGAAGGERIVFYCRSGERSAAASEAFAASGREAHSIAGGLVAWAEAGLPLDPSDGQVAEREQLPPA
jgi:rhodanese-related sulfurtransferase